MVKLILLCDLFIFCHNLITWLIPEQCHILNDTVAIFQVFGQWAQLKKVAARWAGSARERDREPRTG